MDQTVNPIEGLGGGSVKSAQAYDLFSIIEAFLDIVLFLLPLFFLTFTANAIEFNKVYLIVVFAAVSLVLFSIRAVQKKTLRINSLEAYFAPVIFLIGAVVSTIFSQNQRISFFGAFNSYANSLILFAAFFVIAFVVSNVNFSFRKSLNFLSAGVTLTTIVSFVAMYFAYLPLIGSVSRVFTTAGGLMTLFSLQIFVVFYAFYELSKRIVAKDSSIDKINIFYSVTIIFNLVYLLVGMNVLSIGLLVFALAYVILSGRIKVSDDKKYYVAIGVSVILFTFVNYFPITRDILQVPNFNQIQRLGVTESWLVSASTIREKPLTGSGLGTFLYDFTRFRPASLNAADTWQSRFVRPYNDVFLWLSTAGLIGIFAYALFWIFIIKGAVSASANSREGGLLVLLSSLIFLELLLLGPNLVLFFMLFIVFARSVQLRRYSVLSVQANYARVIFLALSVLILGLTGFRVYKAYLAQNLFRKGITTADLGTAYQYQRNAIAADPYESIYRRQSMSTNLLIATELSKRKDLSDTDKQQVTQLISQAAVDARILTEVVNPLDVANWEARGDLYSALIGVADNADQFAITAYTNAIQLESTNPELWIKLGGIYYRQKQYPNAIQAFSQAVRLKNDHANAHYNLAFALKDGGYIFDAVTQLEIVERLLPADHPNYESVTKTLKDFRKEAEETAKKIQEQKAKQQAQLDLKNQTKESVDQGKSNAPLTSPAQGAQISPEVEIPQETIEPGPEPVTQEGAKENQTQGEQPAGTKEEVPAANGAKVDENAGETESPIANPPAE